MFVINTNRRCGDPTEFSVNKIQETRARAPLHTLTPRHHLTNSHNKKQILGDKKFGMSICWIMKVFQLRVSLIITRKIYSIIVLSNVAVVLITLD